MHERAKTSTKAHKSAPKRTKPQNAKCDTTATQKVESKMTNLCVFGQILASMRPTEHLLSNLLRMLTQRVDNFVFGDTGAARFRLRLL